MMRGVEVVVECRGIKKNGGRVLPWKRFRYVKKCICKYMIIITIMGRNMTSQFLILGFCVY